MRDRREREKTRQVKGDEERERTYQEDEWRG